MDVAHSSEDGSTENLVKAVESERAGSDTCLSLDLFRTLPERLRRRRGLLWLTAAIFLQAAQMIMVGNVSNLLGPTETTFFRGLPLTLMVFFVSWERAPGYGWTEMGLVILLGVADNVSNILVGAATLYVWTGVATTIIFNIPLPGALLACVLFGEDMDVISVLLAVVNACGLVLVSEPPFLFPQEESGIPSPSSSISSIGLLLSFGALANNLLVYLCARSLPYREAEDTYLLMASIGLFSLPLTSCASLVTSGWVLPSSGADWFAVVCLCVFSLSAVHTFLKSLETESVLTVSIFLTFSILLTTLYDFIFSGRQAEVPNLCGVALILTSTFSLFAKDLFMDRSRELER